MNAEGSEFRLAELLGQKRATITTAESCTGGLLAGALVNVPGISEWFREGFITYSDEAKERRLSVSHDTLGRYGAVSALTAEEMAAGAAGAAGADLAVSTTGIAGPGGGSTEKPVGLVYIGGFYKGRTRHERHVFDGDRAAVRSQAVQAAIGMAMRMLEEG